MSVKTTTMAGILFFLLFCGCNSIPSKVTDVAVTKTQKLVKTFPFVLQSCSIQGANFSAVFSTQAQELLSSCMKDRGLAVVTKGKEILPAFTYYIDLKIYEFDYINNLTQYYATHIVLIVKDDFDNVLVTINCVSDAELSAGNARYLYSLLKDCVRELYNTLTER